MNTSVLTRCSRSDPLRSRRPYHQPIEPRKPLTHQRARRLPAGQLNTKSSPTTCHAASLDTGAGGQDPPDRPTSLTSEREPEGEGDQSKLDALLKEDAMRRGSLSAKDLEAWLRISKNPALNWICQMSTGFRNRMLGNPQFVLVLLIEQAIGISAKLAAEINSRKERFWKEFPMVASDLALEIFGDFFVVWILSPKKTFAQAPKDGLSRAIAGLPGHVLQVGKFSPAQRVACLFYKAVLFFAAAFSASVVGHSLAKFAVAQQKKANPEDDVAELAPVWDNSVGWGSFVAVSTNLRYQAVGAFEERVIERALGNPTLKSLVIFLIRFGNTFVGGAQWIGFAKSVGLQ